jgi:hypothetical protein
MLSKYVRLYLGALEAGFSQIAKNRHVFYQTDGEGVFGVFTKHQRCQPDLS